MKVLLGELGAEITSKALGYPQGLPENENTGENVTGSFGHSCGSQGHIPAPCSLWQSTLPLVGTSTLRSNMQPPLTAALFFSHHARQE